MGKRTENGGKVSGFSPGAFMCMYILYTVLYTLYIKGERNEG